MKSWNDAAWLRKPIAPIYTYHSKPCPAQKKTCRLSRSWTWDMLSRTRSYKFTIIDILTYHVSQYNLCSRWNFDFKTWRRKKAHNPPSSSRFKCLNTTPFSSAPKSQSYLETICAERDVCIGVAFTLRGSARSLLNVRATMSSNILLSSLISFSLTWAE